ncbi:hypothetical protein BCR35DRAFT_325164 [Leucosporidium creatinivorum]|uniref:Uncharacterized protein n=1 Tax=Leucosporidium creatinivorum TaxID=106004 RepID=A0A1Y2FA15_9BASI|nr:hypothetical protein BCR35DRAFT_325164 [Leucosporidium creatinivorum]
MPLPQDAVGPLTSLVVSLINLQSPPSRDYPKRYYSALFRELPARELYPDYYVFIKEPRSLNGIVDSMKKGIYSSPHAVAYDLFLIWSNARQYNQQGSQVYADADLLESHMRKLWNERSPPLPPFANLLRPEHLNPPTAPAPAPAHIATPAPEKTIKRIKLTSSYSATPPPPPPQAHASISGTPAPARASAHLRVAGPGPSTPAPSTPSNPPLTLKLALKPPAPPSASAGPSYASASPMGTPGPAYTGGYDETPKEKKRSRERETTPGGTEKLRTERKREKKAREKAEKKAREKAEKEAAEAGREEQTPIIPGIPDVETGWMSADVGPNPREVYLDIIRKLREQTDANGRPLATPLLTVPDPTSRPDYHQIVKDPIALDIIENKARNGLYPSPEAFDRDLYHLFTVAKLFIRRDSPGSIYSDLIVLQRLYHELTKRRSALDPAPSLSGSLASVSVGPGNAAIKNEDSTIDAQTGLTSRVTLKDKIFLESINFKGQVFRSGDWVHLLNPDNPKKPIIGQIFKVYKRPDSPQRCISVCWYYRPEETVHPASRQFYENEVFKTGNFSDHSIEDFVERCLVMYHSKYVRGRPKAPVWTPGMPIYVCEHRYKDDVKIFKKIKNWPLCLPEEVRRHEYDFEPFPNEHVDQPLRVKSPFVRGVEGPGRLGESVGGQEAEQTKYHFLPGGEPTTPSVMKAVREQQRKKQEEEAAALAQRQAEVAAKAAATAPALYGHHPPTSNIVTLGSPAVASPSPATPIPIILRPDLAHSLSASSLQSPPQAQPQAPPTPVGPPPGATPAEIALMTESFAELPGNLKSKFRSDPLGDLLWFTAPSAQVPMVTKPSHSLEYLYWRAMQKKQGREEREGR